MHRLEIQPLLIYARLPETNNKNVTSFLLVLKSRWFQAIITIVRNYFGRVDCTFPASCVTLWSNGTSSFWGGGCLLTEGVFLSLSTVTSSVLKFELLPALDVSSHDVIRWTLPSNSLLPVHSICSNRGEEFFSRFTMWLCCTMSLLVIMASGKYLYQLSFRI